MKQDAIAELQQAATNLTDEKRTQLTHQLYELLNTDTLGYLAADAAYAEVQTNLFTPILALWEAMMGQGITPRCAIHPLTVPQSMQEKWQEQLSKLSNIELVTLYQLASRLGSAIAGFLILIQKITAIQANQACFSEEILQRKRWGADDEAEKRLQIIEDEVQILENFIQNFIRRPKK